MHIMQQQPGHSELQTAPVFIQPVMTLNKEIGLLRRSNARGIYMFPLCLFLWLFWEINLHLFSFKVKRL